MSVSKTKRIQASEPQFHANNATFCFQLHPHQPGRDDVIVCVEEVYPGNPNNPIIAEAVLGIADAEFQKVIGDHHILREKVLEMGAVINDVRRVQYQQSQEVTHFEKN